jgi:8-oxo-dGTP pyrophosphatase MutT (NUDIX family)
MKEAAISIIFYDNKVLLVKRRDVPVWVLPGGGIDDGESPENACIREAKEETGLDVSIDRKVGTWLPVNKIGAPAHVFVCHAIDPHTPLTPQEESQEVRFFALQELPRTFFFLHRTWLNAALKNSPNRIYLMTELTYWKCLKTLVQHPIYALRYLLTRITH